MWDQVLHYHIRVVFLYIYIMTRPLPLGFSIRLNSALPKLNLIYSGGVAEDVGKAFIE
jgi:hypothetical protein